MNVEEFKSAFEAKYGEGSAARLIGHVHSHDNGLHDKPGSDELRWAVVIAIGHQCPKYEAWLGGEEDFKAFCTEHRHYIARHDGESDMLAAVCGAYNFLVDAEKAEVADEG